MARFKLGETVTARPNGGEPITGKITPFGKKCEKAVEGFLKAYPFSIPECNPL